MLIICSDRIEDMCAECGEEAWHWRHTSSCNDAEATREMGLHKFKQRPPHEVGKVQPSQTCHACGATVQKKERP